MRRAFCLLTAAAIVLGVSAFSTNAPHAQEPSSFEKDIKPIFESTCWTCHNASTHLAQLDLVRATARLKGGEHGPVLVPGRADDSKLYRLVAGLEKPAMPLDGRTLTPQQVAAIKAWIDDGAHWGRDGQTRLARRRNRPLPLRP